MAQVTHTVGMLAGGITTTFGGAITEPLKIAACLGGAFCISWQLTLACLTMALCRGFSHGLAEPKNADCCEEHSLPSTWLPSRDA